ncbi:MAG TPA: PAS domain S-box protein, partial [Methanospirillum sp.]|nr:PAS domain S-box protein [Methanospirillum sp.]
VSKIEVKINKNGSDHWYEISIMNIVLRPASVFIAAIASNVTDKIETRKQLLESEAMYRSLFEKAQIPINESDYSLYIDLLNATGVPMIIWDSSLVITWVSDGLNVLCGYSGSYLQGKNLNLICCEKEIITQITRFSAQMNEQNGFFEIPVLHQSGRIKHVRWYSINKVRASDGKEKYAAIVREISPYPVF